MKKKDKKKKKKKGKKQSFRRDYLHGAGDAEALQEIGLSTKFMTILAMHLGLSRRISRLKDTAEGQYREGFKDAIEEEDA